MLRCSYKSGQREAPATEGFQPLLSMFLPRRVSLRRRWRFGYDLYRDRSWQEEPLPSRTPHEHTKTRRLVLMRLVVWAVGVATAMIAFAAEPELKATAIVSAADHRGVPSVRERSWFSARPMLDPLR